MPFGSLPNSNAAFATSWMPTPRSVPAMAKRPSLNSMSTSAASSMWAASFLPLVITLSATMTMAPPLIVVEREPPVPMPKATASVSPWMNLILSGSTPSWLTSIWVWMVLWPWPCEIEPVTKVMPPSGSKRISAVSMVGSAACSMVLEMPMPRSLPRFAASFRRASKPFQSPSVMARSMFSSKRPLS